MDASGRAAAVGFRRGALRLAAADFIKKASQPGRLNFSNYIRLDRSNLDIDPLQSDFFQIHARFIGLRDKAVAGKR